MPVADDPPRSAALGRAYRWYRAWAGDGTLDRIHDALRDQVRVAAGRDPNPSAAVVDAQSIKSSEGGQDRGFDMGKKTTGRKRHLIVDTLGLLLVVMVTSASVQDPPVDEEFWHVWLPGFPRSAWCGPMADTPTPSTTACWPGRRRN
jgi:transposase